MGFLIAEVLGLLALAAIAGGAFVYWWVRRRFVDVSAEYEKYLQQLTEVDALRNAASDAASRIATLETENAQAEVRVQDELAWRTVVQQTIQAITPADMAQVERTVAAVDQHVHTLRNADLSGVDSRIKGLTDAVGLLEKRIRPAPAPDFTGIHQRLDELEKALNSGRKAAPTEEAPTRLRQPVGPRPTREPGGNLLAEPKYGRPDDLKRISGVGPKLEGMLNDMGVYYFWQLSDWREPDVEFVDEQLQVFKGRIERDDWVQQAKTLARAEGTSQPPTLSAHA